MTLATESCIYTGSVMHFRPAPVRHRFVYSLSWLYLNLDELPKLLEEVRFLSEGRWGIASFRREDHFGRQTLSLKDEVRELVRKNSGVNPIGPICLLTQPRSWGRYFSPLNLYYCFDESGSTIEAVVAEVTNTPWRESKCYVLTPSQETRGGSAAATNFKSLHVSPFLPMDLQYRWRLAMPGERLVVGLGCYKQDCKAMFAAMKLLRRPLTSKNLLSEALYRPGGANRILAAIYWEALKLWIKQCPLYPHPRGQT